MTMAFKTKPGPCTVCICFYVLSSNSLFLYVLLISISAKDMKCVDLRKRAYWSGRQEHTNTSVAGMRERREEGESALSHLWICHFATTVNVTFAQASNKMHVGMCVFMCIRCAWLWVCTFSVCALTYSDQISIIVCRRCYRVWDHA